jgi:predicted O-methyltransferase YrrM
MINIPSMDQWNALSLIARELDIANPFTLDAYAHEDPHGGYHAAYDDGFPSGSLWRVEGQILYALVRALRPANALELGTWHGASATHILQAIHDNKYGGLTCIDNRAYGNVEIGGMIPAPLKKLAFVHQTRIETFFPHAIKEGWTYDFIFEDAMHLAPQVEFVWQHADKLLNPGGVIVSHDAMHAGAGEAVREGIAQAGYGEKTLNLLISPADCGFAIWRKGVSE